VVGAGDVELVATQGGEGSGRVDAQGAARGRVEHEEHDVAEARIGAGGQAAVREGSGVLAWRVKTRLQGAGAHQGGPEACGVEVGIRHER